MTITPRETGSILDGEAAAPSAASVGTAGHSAPVEGDIRARSTVGVGYHHSCPSDQPTPDSREADPVTGAAMHVHGLTLYYGDKPALKDISLTIPRRRITALIGPSGSGKTSLLSCLNRLIDLTPAARVDGRVDLDGSDIRSTDTDVISLRRRVGMIFQKPAPFPLSIRRNIELPLIDHGLRVA
ncbi:MAG: ATP-binding cassette domain-containing protein, partial [Phycisphaerae bacterium]